MDYKLTQQTPEFSDNKQSPNLLWNYVQNLHPETISQLSKPNSEVAQIMERNLNSILGNLPPEHFGVTVTTTRENLGQLLISAMMNGYFLNNVEKRMELEKTLSCE
jgi:hypothetical protein